MILQRIRAACLRLPGAGERPSHGAPTFLYRGNRSFLTHMDDHHGGGRLATRCAAPPGRRAVLVGAEREHHFVPPHAGGRGWLGARRDRGLPWEDTQEAIEQAYPTAAGGRRRAR